MLVSDTLKRIMVSLKWTRLEFLRRCNHVRPFKQTHAQLLTGGFLLDDTIINRVVEFFGTSIDFADYACKFLKHIDRRISSFSFNTLVSSYATCDKPKIAFSVYRKLVTDGFSPDMYTFPVVFKSCAKFSGVLEGMQIHGVVIKIGFEFEVYVQNSIVHLYSVCGECGDAYKVFDEIHKRDSVSWTGMISGFVKAALFKEAVVLFLKMEVEPNSASFVSVLVACGKLGHLILGKGIHGMIVKRGFAESLEVGNSLIDMYVKSEFLSDAKRIFNELDRRDVVSWTSIMSGLVNSQRPKESLELFCQMQESGVKPDGVILTSVLSACASLGALDYGRWVHEYILHKGIKWDIHIGSAMIDMYAKCGCIDTALAIFNKIPGKNVFTWNVLLGGLAMHGHGGETLQYFTEMERMGVKPNEVSFLAVLSACCHAGFVEVGRKCFDNMTSNKYNLSPRLEHFGCMVDLFCRAGLLDDALEVVKSMPMPPDVLICGTLLNACKAKGMTKLPQDILNLVSELESRDSGVYVLLSNIYAINERWGDVTTVRKLMKEKGVVKVPGSSSVQTEKLIGL